MMYRLVPVLLLIVGFASAAEPPPAVIDNEHLFGKEAIARVGVLAEDLREVNQLDLCIETLKGIEGVTPEKQRRMRDRELLRELRKAAQDRADLLGVNGLYVMITTDPKHVTVIGWPEYRERTEEVSSHKRKELAKALSRMDLGQGPDKTLVQAIEQYRAVLRAPPRPSPLQALPAAIVAGGLMGLWLLLRLIRNSNEQPIYQPAMLGTIFGVPASFWINDRLFESERPVLPPAVEAVEPTVPAPEPAIIPEPAPEVPAGDPP